MIKVSVSGTLSTGKTEFVEALAKELTDRGVRVAVAREAARQCPFPLDKDETLPAALWLAARIITNELDAAAGAPPPHVVLCDRSIIDVYAYMDLVCAQHADPEGLRNIVTEVARRWSATYAVAFLSLRDPNVSIQVDGLRPADVDFQQAVESAIITAFGRFGRTPTHLPHSLEARLRDATDVIGEVLDQGNGKHFNGRLS